MKTITIEIPENKTLKEVEELLAKNGIEIVSHGENDNSEEEYCNMPHMPNAETRKAIEDVIAGKVFRAKNVDDLMKQLDE